MSSPQGSWRKRRVRARCRPCDRGAAIFTKNYTRYEKARIVGARALQVSMGAPVLVEVPDNTEDPIDIALFEFDKGAIPITVVRRLPGEKRSGAPA